TNEARKKEGLPPLKVQPKLVAAARKHAELMARNMRAEAVIDGKGHEDRLEEGKYEFALVANNISFSKKKGTAAAETAVKAWLKSPTNRNNVLNKTVTEIGVGVATDANGHSYISELLAAPQKELPLPPARRYSPCTPTSSCMLCVCRAAAPPSSATPLSTPSAYSPF